MFDDFDFEDFIDILPDDVGQTGTDPTTGGGISSGGFDWGSVLGNINKLFTGTSPLGKAGALVAAGGIGKLLNDMMGGGQQGPAGYQGGIPVYTASRQQTPLSMQRPAGYRPGQGGITYFTPMTYTATGKDMAAPAAGDVIGGGGLGSLPPVQPSGPTMRPLSAATGATTPSTAPRATPSNVPAIGSPERAAFEQRLASQMTPQAFQELQANPNSVLSPSFNAQLQANLAGQQELARRGMTSVFGSEFRGTTPEEIQAFNQALMIERPMGGNITTNNDLNSLLQEYMSAAEAGDVGRARGAFSRMENLGLGVRNINNMANVLDPEFSTRLYNKFVDPKTNVPSKPLGYVPYSDYFTSGSGGWKLIAQDKARWGMSDEDIAYGMGMSVEEVKNALAAVPEMYKKWPPGAASGGYMPGGIAMLARGGNGGRYLRGPGDGVSDSIPAKFEHSGQPARLADGEFVIDARTVSELGNGSSEAGARKLYAMMDRVHRMRKQAKRGKPSGADRELNKLVRGK